MGLLEQMENDINLGEGQEIEFIEDFPSNTHELAKEIAAFATSNTGVIYLGITDDGEKVGVDKKGKTDRQIRDFLNGRIAGVAQKGVQPAIRINVEFIQEKNSNLYVRITVPKGNKPVYYSNNKPYIRNISNSEPATPDQVEEIFKEYFQREATSIRQDMVFLKTLDQLSDFELMWSDYKNRMVNPDFEQLKYDFNATGETLIQLSFEKDIKKGKYDKDLKNVGELMTNLSDHRFFLDGGKSFNKFKEKGEKIAGDIQIIIPRLQKRIKINENDLEQINDNLVKIIQEITYYWENRNEFLKGGKLSLLKDNLRRLAYSLNRTSNIPPQYKEQFYIAELKNISYTIRELSSMKYFMKGIGINPIDLIKKDMENVVLQLNNIKTRILSD